MKCACSLVRWKCPPLGRAALAAPKKKMQGGGALSGSGHGCFAGGGRTLAHLFRGGGSKNYYLGDLYWRGPKGDSADSWDIFGDIKRRA